MIYILNSIEVCSETEGMSNTQTIPAKSLTSNVPTSIPEDARPGRPGWVVPTPTPALKPELIVDLTSESAAPVYVKSIKLNGNTKTVTVRGQETPNDPITDILTSVDVSDGEIRIGKTLSTIVVVPETTKGGDEKFTVVLQVTACFKFKGEYF